MKTGTVFKSTGSHYKVVDDDAVEHTCIVRGKLRLHGWKSTNPIAVGDKVDFSLEGEFGIISHIHERKNHLIRKATNASKQTHVIAANIDQALLIVTLFQPKISEGFIDRFLVSCEAYDIPVKIIFNKSDLITGGLVSILEELMEMYEHIGYECYVTSTFDRTGIDELDLQLEGKTSLFSGFSGVGKSSLINTIVPNIEQKTAEISNFSQKGKHTTTFAEMFEIRKNTYLIDTPGIKELGVVAIEGSEISHFFPEMRAVLGNCKFNTCTHRHEPQCAVIEAVESGLISASRYHSYLSIFDNEDTFR